MVQITDLNMKRSTCTFALLFISFSAFPSDVLNKYITGSSKAIIEFYMVELSNGDKKHQYRHDELVKEMNDLSLSYRADPQFSALVTRWNKIHEKLYFDGGYNNYSLNPKTRVQIRDYLDFTYAIQKRTKPTADLQELIAVLMLDIAIVSALYFDAASLEFGNPFNNIKTVNINLQNVSVDIAEKISLLSAVNDGDYLNESLAIKSKWNLLKKSIIEYEDLTSYMFIYHNVGRIFYLLRSIEHQL
jgi:hypothetical protein